MIARRLPLLLGGALAFSTRAGEQPLTRTAAGHIATEVTLQAGRVVLFTVDTGAGSSALYEPMRRRLELSPDPGSRVELQGAAGAQVVERYRLPVLSVAGVQARDLLVAGLPSGVSHGDEVMGLLGRDVLSGRVAEFDLVRGRLGLHAPGTVLPSLHGWHAVPFLIRPHVGLIEFTLELGGRPVAAVLDTGAQKSIANWRAAAASGISRRGTALRRRSSGGATSHAFDYVSAPFPSIAVGRLPLREASLAIADLPVFGALGMSGVPTIIVGLDLLDGRRFVVDYPGRRLLFELPPDGIR